MLDADWQAFLQPPPEILAGGVGAEQTVAATLQRYQAIAADPRYATLAQRPEFAATHTLLRDYLSLRTRADTTGLSLPPPPR
jgi:hypothetical protein